MDLEKGIRTLFRAIDGLFLAFVLPFVLWHGNGGNQTAQFNLKAMQKSTATHSYAIYIQLLCDLDANHPHLSQSVSAAPLCFKI